MILCNRKYWEDLFMPMIYYDFEGNSFMEKEIKNMEKGDDY